jgi:hypothetical protein
MFTGASDVLVHPVMQDKVRRVLGHHTDNSPKPAFGDVKICHRPMRRQFAAALWQSDVSHVTISRTLRIVPHTADGKNISHCVYF